MLEKTQFCLSATGVPRYLNKQRNHCNTKALPPPNIISLHRKTKKILPAAHDASHIDTCLTLRLFSEICFRSRCNRSETSLYTVQVHSFAADKIRRKHSAMHTAPSSSKPRGFIGTSALVSVCCLGVQLLPAGNPGCHSIGQLPEVGVDVAQACPNLHDFLRHLETENLQPFMKCRLQKPPRSH